MQNKTLLKKLVGLVAVVCLALAMVFGLVGCGESEPTVKQTSVQGNKIIVELTDGTKNTYSIDEVIDVKKLADGKVELTCANGEKVTMNYNSCSDHVFTSEVKIRPASCYEEGVSLKVCKNCGFVERGTLAKDPKIHGKWVLEDEITKSTYQPEKTTDGKIRFSRVDEGHSYYILKTEYEGSIMTLTEAFSGVAETCFTAKCALCGEIESAGHAPKEQWKPVNVTQAVVNPCTDEHKQAYACPDCNATLLSEEDGSLIFEYVPATGHSFKAEVTGEKSATERYVKLTCESCGYVIPNIVATFDHKVEPTCMSKDSPMPDVDYDGQGYNVYNYTYPNYVAGKYKTNIPGTIEYDFVNRSEIHTVKDEAGTKYEAYTVEKTDYKALPYNELLFNTVDEDTGKKLLRWNEGQTADCKVEKTAVFDCAICGEVIVIKMRGPHNYGVTQEKAVDCTTDGYSYQNCTICDNKVDGHQKRFDYINAEGHKWTYKDNSFDAGKASVVCSVCKAVRTDQTATLLNPAKNCTSQDEYKIVISNENKGKLGAKDLDVPFSITPKENDKKHTIAGIDGTTFVRAYENGIEYDYDKVADVFGDKIKWKDEQDVGNCLNAKLATFKCSTCEKDIDINLKGKHVYGETPVTNDVPPTCTDKGYTTKTCTVCGPVIVEGTGVAAKDHKFTAVETELNSFKADPANCEYVTYSCSDCQLQVVLKPKMNLDTDVGYCMTVKVYTYKLYYNVDEETIYTYFIDSATGEKDVKKELITDPVYIVETEGAHRLGLEATEGHGIDVKAFNIKAPGANVYDYNGNPLKSVGVFFDDGTLRWNEGKPAGCDDSALAVFECKRCDQRVVIEVYGPHKYMDYSNMTEAEIANYKHVVDSTCTEGGYTEEYCLGCKNWQQTDLTDPLGHKLINWTNKVDGELFAEVYLDNGVVKLNEQTLNLGYSECICDRCLALCKATPRKSNFVEPDCVKAGSLTVNYYYYDNIVEKKDILVSTTEEITIEHLDEHVTHYTNSDKYVKVYIAETEKYELWYWCAGCKSFVEQWSADTEAEIDNIIKNVLHITYESVIDKINNNN